MILPVFNLRKQKVTYSLNDPDLVDFLKDNSESSNYISAKIALQNSDIYSLIAQLSGDLALVKFKAATSRAQRMLNNPSQTSNGFSFWQSMYAQLLLDGNAYAYRWKNSNGVDLYWEFLRPSQVEPQLLEDGSGLVYNISFDEPERGMLTGVPSVDMIHIRLMSSNGGKTGVSPLMALANELNIQKASNRLTLNALNKSVEAPGILSVTGGGLLDWQKKSARSRQFMKQVNNSNGGPIVLDDLETYQPLEVKGDVAKLLSQADWTGKQIAKVYGIPDSYLNGQGDQQSNITQISGQYAKSLKRYVEPISSELNNKLNTTITTNIRPAVDALGDDFATSITTMTRYGVLTGNQAQDILQKNGYLPDKLPNRIKEGGDANENSDEGSRD